MEVGLSNDAIIRLLCLAVAVLAASLTGTVTSWISWAIEPNIGQALLAGGASFAGCALLVLTAIRFLTGRDA